MATDNTDGKVFPGGPYDEGISVDLVHEATVGIDAIHHEIHEGGFWSYDFLNEALADNAAISVFFSTGTLPAHMRFSAAVGGDAKIEIFEDVTMGNASGTLITGINRNRVTGDSTQPGASLYSGGTMLTSGIIIHISLAPGGQKNQAGGASSGLFEEWILKPDSEYFMSLRNISSATKIMGGQIDFYEPALI